MSCPRFLFPSDKALVKLVDVEVMGVLSGSGSSGSSSLSSFKDLSETTTEALSCRATRRGAYIELTAEDSGISGRAVLLPGPSCGADGEGSEGVLCYPAAWADLVQRACATARVKVSRAPYCVVQ